MATSCHELLGLLEVDGAAVLRAFFATHVLFGLDSGGAVDGGAVDHVHVDLGAGSDVVGGHAGDLRLGLVLLVLGYLDLLRGDLLSACRVELVVEDLVVVDERRALRALGRSGRRRVCSVARACVDVGDAAGRVEESSTELLAARRRGHPTLIFRSSAVLHAF